MRSVIDRFAREVPVPASVSGDLFPARCRVRPHPDRLNTGCWIFSLLGKILRNWNSLSSFSLQQATPAL